MTTHIKSINRKVWKVVEIKIKIEDLENPTTTEEVLLQNNDIALSVIHDAIDERTFEQIKNIEISHEAWKKLEESFEGTTTIKGAKAYIL
jgi:ethanolamine ammonia-lyase large subunit